LHIWIKKIVEHFRRVTNSGAFVPEIDGLRFVAIASVIAFHLYGQLVRYYGVHLSSVPTTLLHNGDRGVRLFFVISGFVLARPFAAHWLQASAAVDLKRYFGRRLTRLEPPYILNLVICAALMIALNHVALAAVVLHLLASLLYLHTAVYGMMSTINPVAWSLEIEVQFYLLMPLLALVFAIRSVWIRRCALLLAMLLIELIQIRWFHTARSHGTVAYYLQFFLAGLFLADLHLLRKSNGKSWWWDAISLAGWPLVFALADPVSQLVLPFLMLALYWAAFHGPITNRLVSLPLVTIIGGMCYTIYLFHFLLIAFATRILGHARPPLVVTFVSLALIATVCPLYFLLIERPCMDRDWPRKLLVFFRGSRKEAPAPAYGVLEPEAPQRVIVS